MESRHHVASVERALFVEAAQLRCKGPGAGLDPAPAAFLVVDGGQGEGKEALPFLATPLHVAPREEVLSVSERFVGKEPFDGGCNFMGPLPIGQGLVDCRQGKGIEEEGREAQGNVRRERAEPVKPSIRPAADFGLFQQRQRGVALGEEPASAEELQKEGKVSGGRAEQLSTAPLRCRRREIGFGGGP